MPLKPDIAPDTPEARGKRIKYIRVDLLNISRRELSENSNIGAPTLKGWEIGLGGGVSKIGAERLVNRLKDFNVYCSSHWILHGLGPMPRIGADIAQTDEERQIIDELLLFRRQENAIDTRIIDDSMLPTFRPGNYVAGIIAQDLMNCLGKRCIVITAGQEKLVRILERDPKSQRYTLVCENQRTELVEPVLHEVEVIAAAPIIFIRKKNPERIHTDRSV